MKYEVELSDNFRKEAKRLIRKYRSLKGEIDSLSDQEIEALIKDL